MTTVKACFSILLLTALALPATAGDYFPYRPKRLTYEFAIPFEEAGAPKLPAAKLTITTQTDNEGRYPYRMGIAPLASIEIELGKERLSVPKQLLREIGPLDLNSLDFYWVGMRYYLALSRKPPAEAKRPERVEFVFSNGSLVDLLFDRASQRGKHPEVFGRNKPASP